MAKLQRFTIALFVFLFAFGLSFPLAPVKAAALTNLSDTLTTLAQGTAADHEIEFTTPSGVAEGETFTLTFDADFTMGSVGLADIDVADDTVDLTTAADCTGSEEAGVSVAGQVVTVEICSGDGGAIAASSVINVEIGTNAGGANQITNPAAAETSTIDVGGTFADSGSMAVVIIADDSVAVTAQVDPTITFSISDTAIGFGDLTAANARYANAGATGSDTDVVAHTMAVSTNADNGYAITYNGTTLTSGSNTIDVASINDDADGTPGSEEFGISMSSDGDATIATGYDHGDPDWTFVDSTTTTIVSETGPTATETLSVRYLANIAGNTEAGDYSTNITFIATATF